MGDRMLIVSWNGASDTGGVERVTQYMIQAWKNEFEIEIVDFSAMRKRNLYKVLLNKHYVIDALLVSYYTNKRIRSLGRKNTKIVTQGFNAPFVKSDISFAHGTMRGLKIALEGKDAKWHFNQYFEKIAMNKANRIVAVGNHVKDELQELYGVDKDKICVIENCVDTDIFYPIAGGV